MKLYVELGESRYPIYIGAELLNDENIFIENIRSKQVLVVSNETVAPLFLDKLLHNLQQFTVETFIMPDGESYKTLEMMHDIVGCLLAHKFHRNSTIIALGGGVVGDVAGFAAACYQRGINYMQVPTTLLAQVDSSVGGKTAVNHNLGKNMLGAFHQPIAVVTDISVLNTLSDRQLSAGIAEIIKYGLIRDADFFVWLENNMDALLNKEHIALSYAVERSCFLKAEIVAADEREHGLRGILNLGHTFGHAIETELHYQNFLHGEAVACGMLMAADLSASLGWLDPEIVSRLHSLLQRANLPVLLPDKISIKNMKKHMLVDKKSRGELIVLVLLKTLGEALISDQYDPAMMDVIMHKYSTTES